MNPISTFLTGRDSERAQRIDFQDEIKDMLKNLFLTQADLAKIYGKSKTFVQSALNKYKTNRYDDFLDTLFYALTAELQDADDIETP